MAGLFSKLQNSLKIVIFVVSILFAPSIYAQDTAETTSVELEKLATELSPEERMDMLARLSDNDIREMMINYLNQAGQTTVTNIENESMFNMLESSVDVVRGNMALILSRIPDIPDAFLQVQAKISEERGPFHIFIVFASTIGLMLVAFGAELFLHRIMIRKSGVTEGKGNRLLVTVVDFVSLAIFSVFTIVGFLIFYQGHLPSRALFLTYFTAVIIVRLVMILSRLVLSPRYPHLRFFDVDDNMALYWNRAAFQLAIIGAFGFLSCGLMARFGVDPQLHFLLTIIVGIVFIALLVRAIWQGRKSVSEIILGSRTGSQNIGIVKRAFASSWHIIVIVYVIAVFVFAVTAAFAGNPIGVNGVLLSLAMVILLPLADAFVSKIATRTIVNEKNNTDDQSGEVQAKASVPGPYARIIIRASRLLLIILALIILANLWGVDFFGMAKNNVGGFVMGIILDIGITCLLAYVVWEFSKAAIDRQLKREGGDGDEPAEGEGGGAGGSRLVTLLPLFRKFLLVTILVMAAMIILSSMGVDIGPMIAGAGVVGLAVGFGAQTLVKDIVSGVFFLVDDAFRIDEYVDVGSVMGTVERINVRSLTLRHHLGPLHTVPFGEIGHLTNFSRDWVIMKMAFRVTYDTDMTKVKKIFKKIGADMLADETIGQDFLDPFKSQGVKAMEDSAMIIRAKFKTKPGKQFTIRKEAYQRVQAAFKEAGIEFAHRRVQVDLPEGIDPRSAYGEAIAEAAGAAVVAEDDAKSKK